MQPSGNTNCQGSRGSSGVPQARCQRSVCSSPCAFGPSKELRQPARAQCSRPSTVRSARATAAASGARPPKGDHLVHGRAQWMPPGRNTSKSR
eukprot:7980072-Lingulodinium_polyedra.AAC.1